MIELLDISERRACSYAGLSRTSYREPPRTDAQPELSARIVELAHERRRFGYRRIHDLLTREGHAVNHKRVWRLYRVNDLAVRKRRKAKRISNERKPLLRPTAVNQVWSLDFVMDALANGRRIKCLTVVDDFSRECVDIAMDYGIGGEYVTRLLEQAGQFRGFPAAMRTDQGPEFTSRAFMAWAHSRGVQPPAQRRGQPDAERLHRELQRQVPRRVPERAVVRDAGPGPPGDHTLAARLQRGATAQRDRPHPAGTVRRRASPARWRCAASTGDQVISQTLDSATNNWHV